MSQLYLQRFEYRLRRNLNSIRLGRQHFRHLQRAEIGAGQKQASVISRVMGPLGEATYSSRSTMLTASRVISYITV